MTRRSTPKRPSESGPKAGEVRGARERRYVRFPHLATEVCGDICRLYNQAHDATLLVHRDVLTLLDRMREPATLRELHEQVEIAPQLVADLLRSFMLVAEDELPYLGGGLLRPAREPIGQACTWMELPRQRSDGAFVILGAPVDSGSFESGARHGPAEIRAHMPGRRWLSPRAPGEPGAGAERDLIDLEFRRRHRVRPGAVLDLGDIHVHPGEPPSAFQGRLTTALGEVIDRGMTPVLLGGDHSVAWPPLSLLLERHDRLGILHFDAHPDMARTPPWMPLNHANPFAFACAHPSMRWLLQLGLRTLEPVDAREAAAAPDPRIAYVSARELRTLTPSEVFKRVPRGLPCYLSFDIDCLSPEIAPETGSTVAGGLGFYQALELIDHAARMFPIVGADFVEVARGPAQPNRAAQAAARLLAQLLLSRAPFEPLGQHFHRPPAGQRQSASSTGRRASARKQAKR